MNELLLKAMMAFLVVALWLWIWVVGAQIGIPFWWRMFASVAALIITAAVVVAVVEDFT
jgi:hypothetical protein